MASFTGTADNYLDLMTALRDAITTTSPTISWTAVRDTSTSPVGANSPNTTEMIFRGDAANGGSPSRFLYWGIQSYEDPGAGIYGFAVRGFTGFQDGSPVGSVAFEDQPDASKAAYVPLQNTTMTYWIFANERRVIMVVKTGTSYQWMHAGFLDTFATETEYPYPLMIAGSSHVNTVTFSSNSIDYSAFIDPGGDNSENPIVGLSTMYMRFTDGSWYPIKNFYKSGSTAANRTDRNVWPLSGYNNADWPTDGVVNASKEWRQIMYTTSIGGTPTATLAQTPGSPDDISPMYPLTIIWSSPSLQLVGEISGAFWVSNVGGLTSEDDIFDSGVSPKQGYKVFKNVHRTDAWEFGAIKDE